jgi:hypothetical protein
VAYNFQTRNKLRQLIEYKSVVHKVLLDIKSILQNAKQLQHEHSILLFPATETPKII